MTKVIWLMGLLHANELYMNCQKNVMVIISNLNQDRSPWGFIDAKTMVKDSCSIINYYYIFHWRFLYIEKDEYA
jgi:hypothetical protein